MCSLSILLLHDDGAEATLSSPRFSPLYLLDLFVSLAETSSIENFAKRKTFCYSFASSSTLCNSSHLLSSLLKRRKKKLFKTKITFCLFVVFTCCLLFSWFRDSHYLWVVFGCWREKDVSEDARLLASRFWRASSDHPPTPRLNIVRASFDKCFIKASRVWEEGKCKTNCLQFNKFNFPACRNLCCQLAHKMFSLSNATL